MKIGRLKAVGFKLVKCQEILKFFVQIWEVGVGTNVIEARAKKMVGDQDSKVPTESHG